MVTTQQTPERIQSKVRQLIDWLTEEASRPDRPLGSSFPANNEVVRKYNVSLGTAHKAMKTLVESGYLSSKPGSGYVLIKKPDISPITPRFRSAMPQVESLMVIMSAEATPGKVVDTYLQYLYEQCDKAALHLRMVRNRAEELNEALYMNNIKGILFWGAEKPSIDLPEHIPTASFGYSTFLHDSPVVTVDMEEGAFQAFRHLCSMGLSKTAIVSSRIEEWKTMGFGEFVLGMRKAFKDYGMEWTSQSVIDLDNTNAAKEGSILEYLKSQGFTGVFCPIWSDVARLYREAQSGNVKIGQDIALVGYGNHDHLDMFHPSVTRIAWEPGEVVAKAFEVLTSSQSRQRIEKVSVRIVISESTSLIKY